MENKQEKAVIQTNISNSSINCVATKLCQILCVFVVKKGMFGFGNIGVFCKMDWIFLQYVFSFPEIAFNHNSSQVGSQGPLVDIE